MASSQRESDCRWDPGQIRFLSFISLDFRTLLPTTTVGHLRAVLGAGGSKRLLLPTTAGHPIAPLEIGGSERLVRTTTVGPGHLIVLVRAGGSKRQLLTMTAFHLIPVLGAGDSYRLLLATTVGLVFRIESSKRVKQVKILRNLIWVILRALRLLR
jgi:hypothetical protein